ncbi:RusA family crossover junction endodeoxyribonuclease [Klebsiella pneumoniae]
MMIFNITPMGKPRMTRADKWKQREVVMRYRAFCEEVRLKSVTMPEQGAHITFVLPMPASWSQKKRKAMNGQAHQQKPDADNMIKALMDALFADDAHIWDFRVTKVWGETGQILISDIGEVAA